MTLLADQIARIQSLLQDTDSSPTNISKIVTAHQESLTRIARRDAFANIQWVNAIANQATYLLPTSVVNMMQVLYNNQELRYATEVSLDRRFHGYERLTDEPQYWTTDNQAPNTIRVVPAPLRTGDATPVIPSPVGFDTRDNLLLFLSEDVSAGITDPQGTLPTFLDWDDMLVWDVTKMLAERETTLQNLPVSALCDQFWQLWARYTER